jgi:hypothetical protein
MRENESVWQKRIIGIDGNSNNLFGRDEQDLQDATPHRNPVHPVNYDRDDKNDRKSVLCQRACRTAIFRE